MDCLLPQGRVTLYGMVQCTYMRIKNAFQRCMIPTVTNIVLCAHGQFLCIGMYVYTYVPTYIEIACIYVRTRSFLDLTATNSNPPC